MTQTTITVKKNRKDKSPASFQFDFGDSAEDAMARFDGKSPLDKVVFHCFVTTAKQQLQDHIRRLLAAKKNPQTIEQIQAGLALWKPTVKRKGKSPFERAKGFVSEMSDAERRALIAELGGTVPE